MLEHNDFKEALEAEVSELRRIKEKLVGELKRAPEGSLNILQKKKPEYYWYKDRKHRKYLSKKQRDIAIQLAERIQFQGTRDN